MMKLNPLNTIARFLLTEDPLCLQLNRPGGEVEKIDVWLQRWAFKRYEAVHHDNLDLLMVRKMKRFLIKAAGAPFWKSIFEQASFDPSRLSCLRDIERLPVISRKELRKIDLAQRSNLNLPRKSLGGVVGTSGTTGNPIGLYIGKKTAIRSRALLAWTMDNIRLRSDFKKTPSLSLLNLDVGTHRSLYGNTFFVDGRWLENMEKRHTKAYPILFGKKIDVLYAYPSSLKRLMYWMEKDGIRPVSVQAVIYLAEHLNETEKTAIKNFFRCPLYSFYGTKECSFIALECDRNEGFHVLKGWGYVEIISSEGACLPLGSQGRIVYTNFENDATPFIRYDTGDTGMLFDGGFCPCGIAGLKLVVEGRNAETILLPNGAEFPIIKLHGEVSRIFHDKILQLQFQELNHEICIHIVTGHVFTENEIKKMISACQELIGAKLPFTVFFKEKLEVLPSGK